MRIPKYNSKTPTDNTALIEQHFVAWLHQHHMRLEDPVTLKGTRTMARMFSIATGFKHTLTLNLIAKLQGFKDYNDLRQSLEVE